jgi:hypothetical protein
MPQTGKTPIQLFRTSTTAAVPVNTSLVAGELAINISDADMALFAKNLSGVVKRVMNNPAGLKYPTTDGASGKVMKTDGAGVISFGDYTITDDNLTFSVASKGPVLSDGSKIISETGTGMRLIPASDSLPAVVRNAANTADVLVLKPASDVTVIAGTSTTEPVTPAGLAVVTTLICPVGFLGYWPTSTPPEGWLVRDGSAISRTVYAALFAVLGTTYGVGDGSTTFNLPDSREAVSVGYKSGSAEFGVFGGKYGSKTHTLNTTQIPSHTHTVAQPGGPAQAYGWGSNWSMPASVTGSTGGGLAHNNIQVSEILLPIIKY